MTQPIQVGDRVQWTYWDGETMAGTVEEIRPTADGPLATIVGDNGKWNFKPIDFIERITDADLVQAVGALPQADQDREDAVSALLRDATGGAL